MDRIPGGALEIGVAQASERRKSMFGSSVLEVAIGLVLVYLMLSLVCSAINEYIGRLFNWRSKMLEEAMRNMLEGLNDKSLVDKVVSDPLITARIGKKKAWTGSDLKPTYVPARTFALALLNVVAPSPEEKQNSFDLVRASVAKLPPSGMKTALLGLLDSGEGDLKKARENIERWFDETMDEVSAWYRRTANTWLFIVAVMVCVLMNADSLAIGTTLWRDPTLRASVVAAAEKAAKHPPGGPAPAPAQGEGAVPKAAPGAPNSSTASPVTRITDINTELKELKIPIGWTKEELENSFTQGFFRGMAKILGLLFTSVAVALGAPFWFDTLNKLVNLRASGNKPKKTDVERAQPGAAK
jgi:hypothetical protein